MASLNNQQVVTLHRRVKELTYNEEHGGWDIVFIDTEGNEQAGKLPHAPRIGMNYFLALQIIIANYCINNNDDDNLWMPTNEITDVIIQDKGDGITSDLVYKIVYENGINYKIRHPEKTLTDIEIVEQLTLQGIDYFINLSEDKDLVPSYKVIKDLGQNGKVISLFNTEHLTMNVTVMDNANMDVTGEQITRVWRYMLKAAFMLYGMYNTRISQMNYDSGRFSICSDLSIPAFEIDIQSGMKPQIVAFDDITYITCDEIGKLVLSVNE
jgi:hypothetical protein